MLQFKVEIVLKCELICTLHVTMLVFCFLQTFYGFSLV